MSLDRATAEINVVFPSSFDEDGDGAAVLSVEEEAPASFKNMLATPVPLETSVRRC
jgi:hypothetical protein